MLQVQPIDPAYPRGQLTAGVFHASSGAALAGAVVVLEPRCTPGSIDSRDGPCSSQTDQDGQATFTLLPVGEYYIYAELKAHVSLATTLQKVVPLGLTESIYGSQDLLDAVLTRITIREEEASQISLQLEEQGSISGKVTWNDGSPASHCKLAAKMIYHDASMMDLAMCARRGAPELSSYETDENGCFCLLGLYTGVYVVGVKLPWYMPYQKKSKYADGPQLINCFSDTCWTGGRANSMEASAVHVVAGAETKDISIEVPRIERE